MAGESGSPDTWRDVRRFSLKFYTMQWDFWTSNSETAHQVTYLMGERGLPRTWRHMNGYGSHT